MKQRPVLCALSVMVLWMSAGTYHGSAYLQSDKRCGDFAYQEDAQEYYDSGNGRATADYIGMDADNNGVACEALPPRPDAANTLLTLLGPVALIILGVAGVVWWIRRRQHVGSGTITPRPMQTPPGANGPSGSSMQPEVSSTPLAPNNPPVIINVNTSSTSSTIASAKSSAKTAADAGWMTPEKATTMPYSDYLSSRYWKAVRKNNIVRSGGQCTDCGRSDQVLQVHHMSYEFLGREDDRFLVTLCAGCHEKRHDLPAPPGARTS